jgi:hypothetical protein
MLLFWGLAPYSFIGHCQHLGEKYCLHLDGWSDKAGKWRAYMGLEGWGVGWDKEQGEKVKTSRESSSRLQRGKGVGCRVEKEEKKRSFSGPPVGVMFLARTSSCSRMRGFHDLLKKPSSQVFLSVTLYKPSTSQLCHFSPEDGDSTSVQNVGISLQNVAPNPKALTINKLQFSQE